MVVASELIQLIGSTTEKIEIAGSIRRMKPEVSDVELVFIPVVNQVADDLFGSTDGKDLAAERIDQLVDRGIITRRINSVGHIAAWGPLNKLAVHVASGIPVDFFSTSEENWYVSLVVRTGSRDTNLRLTNGALRMNKTLHAYGCGVQDRKTGEMIRCESEEQVFAACGVPYLLPEQR